MDAQRGFASFRNLVDAQRESLAAAIAKDLVADLVSDMAHQPDMIVEDALCERLGTILGAAVGQPPDVRLGPQHVAEAMIAAADAAVRATLTATAGPADPWRAPWRVLTALADILHHPHGEAAGVAIARLRDTAGRRVLPVAPQGPMVSGSVLWTRDRYGSRFAVVAPIVAAGQSVRWYLWDVDACGHEAFTVHSGVHPTPEAALTDWQAGVGEIAAAGTDLAPVDDSWLLAALMPTEGFLRGGGESAEQFVEYFRSRRLGEVVKAAVPRLGTPRGGGIDAAAAAIEFVAWLRDRDADGRQPAENVDELAAELADSWCLNDVDAVYTTCSPHRVAMCVLHLRNYYLDEFAEQLVALLPAWTRWLAARNATPPELVERVTPYAHGQPHLQLGRDDGDFDYRARVIE